MPGFPKIAIGNKLSERAIYMTQNFEISIRRNLDQAIFDRTVRKHNNQQAATGAKGDDDCMLDLWIGISRDRGRAQQLRNTTEHAGGFTHHHLQRFVIGRTFAQLRTRFWRRVTLDQEVINIVSITLIAGDAPGTGMRLFEKAHLCDLGQFVANCG